MEGTGHFFKKGWEMILKKEENGGDGGNDSLRA